MQCLFLVGKYTRENLTTSNNKMLNELIWIGTTVSVFLSDDAYRHRQWEAR